MSDQTEPLPPLEELIFTGSVDGTMSPVPHRTLAEAEAWIAEREKNDPEGVLRGDYYIDTPERKWNL